MKTILQSLCVLVAVWSVGQERAAAQPMVPTTFVQPSSAADATRPGFVWRVHQVATGQPNDNDRSEAQLAGLLGDNIADPNLQGIALGPAAPASPTTAPISFEIAGTINMGVFGGEFNGNFFPDDQMPGLPNTGGGFENAAGEILAWLDLPAGTITLGVNSDDGFRTTLGGSRPTDRFAVKVGEFNGGRGASDTLFSFTISQAGLYAMRCTWENGCCDGNIEMFSVKNDGSRVLVNDLVNGGIPAYRALATPAKAYARKVTPAFDAMNAAPNAMIIVELVDGSAPIDPASIQLSLDGSSVAVSRSKSAGVTTTTYVPLKFYAPGSQHNVAFSYVEGGSRLTVNWKFTVQNYVGPNGNYYELVLVPGGITWPDARLAAESRSLCSVNGHLATITSAEEDVYLESLRQISPPAMGNGQLWVGGFQNPLDSAPTENWFWVNNEGPISGVNGGGTYSNWRFGEPNDNFGFATENYLAIGLFNEFAWNDDGFTDGGRLGGYIIEYERRVIPIDIKPGTSPNPIYLDASGKLPVAILSTPTFDASTVDPATIRFGRTGTEAVPASYLLSDVNGDKRKDLICQFNIEDLGLKCGDTGAQLQASTVQGCPLKGFDSIQVLRCPPFGLTVSALQDVNKNTDVYLAVNPLLSGHIVPNTAQSVQLKSFDIFSRLRWTKTIQTLPLVANSDGSRSGTVRYTDMEHGQNVKAQLQVKEGSAATQVLRGEGRVWFRPDLAVDNVTGPSTVYRHQLVNLFATIRELKGDLSAKANVYLMDGSTVLDVASNVVVNALGNAGVAFAVRLSTEGVHELKIVVGDVVPGDYDLSNNQQAFSVTVLAPVVQPAYFCASYNYNNYEYLSVQDNPYWISTYRETGRTEYMSEWLSIPLAFDFPVPSVTMQIGADGVNVANHETFDLPLSFGYGDDCFSYQYGIVFVGPAQYFVVEVYRGFCTSPQAYVTFYRSAADIVYYSSFLDKYYGTFSEGSSLYSTGEFLRATTSLQTRFVIEGSAGAFGGNAAIPLTAYPYDNPFDYTYDVYHNYGYNRGTNIVGSVCDMTVP